MEILRVIPQLVASVAGARHHGVLWKVGGHKNFSTHNLLACFNSDRLLEILS